MGKPEKALVDSDSEQEYSSPGSSKLPNSPKTIIPLSRITEDLKSNTLFQNFSSKAAVKLAAVIEYLTSELLDMASQEALSSKSMIIKPVHIQSALLNDEEMTVFLKGVSIRDGRLYPRR